VLSDQATHARVRFVLAYSRFFFASNTALSGANTMMHWAVREVMRAESIAGICTTCLNAVHYVLVQLGIFLSSIKF